MSPTTLNRRALRRVAIALGVVLVLVVGIVIAVHSGSGGKTSAGAKGGPGATATGAPPPGSGGTGVDVACGKPATASSTADAAHPASNATHCGSAVPWVSGDLTSSAADVQWLQVDLGGTSAIDHVVVVWGGGYGRKFKIRTSADGESWRTVEKVSDGTGGTETIAMPSGTDSQWVQLYLEQPAQNAAQYDVAQFEVYALPGTATSASGSATGSGSAQWSGQFAGYGTAAWKAQWGYTDTGQFGQADVAEVADPTAPGGSALRVYYGAGSSANSCKDCPSIGGAQFYQKLSDLGSVGATLSNSETLDLKYSIKLPAGWDFGEAGKLPGLYGGTIGQESGGTHGTDGWSTRYMFRGHYGAPNGGEIYLYTPTNSGPTGYGVDYFGNWDWTADGAWHTVEQLVNRQTGSVTVWFDGKQVLAQNAIATGISNIPFSGVFFSTFFGGHDTTWGPKKAEYSYFADFSLSTTVQH